MEPYVIASALVGVVAQRLVRRLCVALPPPVHAGSRNAARAEHHRGRRRAVRVLSARSAARSATTPAIAGASRIYEVMRVNDKVRRLDRAAAPARTSSARRRSSAGMITLGEDGLAKVKSRRDDRRGAAARRHRSARDADALPGLRRRGRRRLHGAARTAATGSTPAAAKCGRALAAGLELLPVLHDEHRAAEAERRRSCANRTRRSSCRRRTSPSSRTIIVEDLLRAAVGRARRPRPTRSSGVPARDRPLPSRQSPASRFGVPGDRGRARRRADRGVPRPHGRGARSRYDESLDAGTTAQGPRPATPSAARGPDPGSRPGAGPRVCIDRDGRPSPHPHSGIAATDPGDPLAVREARRRSDGCARGSTPSSARSSRCRSRGSTPPLPVQSPRDSSGSRKPR